MIQPVPNVEPDPHAGPVSAPSLDPSPPVAVVQMTRAVTGTASQVFQNPDLAWRENRDLQRWMRRDLDIAYALEQRIRAVRRSEWKIVPEDEKDPQHQAEARCIQRAIERIRNRAGLIRNLLLACWYGHSGAFLTYAALDARDELVGVADDETTTCRARFAPMLWTPIHPDSIEFRFSGEPVIKVNTMRLTPEQHAMLLTGTNAPVMRLTPEQRACTVINTFNLEAADYETAHEAALSFSGRGLRSDIYAAWFLKQKQVQAAMMYAERHGRGTTIGRYPHGNAKAAEEVIRALQNILTDAVAAFPSMGSQSEDTFRIEVHEPAGNGWQIHFRMLTQYWLPAILKMIVGQTLSSDTGESGTGMGSGVSDQHEKTFLAIVEDDAEGLDDCMTDQVVRVIQRVNFPESKCRHRYKTVVRKKDVEKILSAVKSFVEMGGKVAEGEIRDLIELRDPDVDDEVLGESQGAIDDHAGHDMLDEVERRNGELNGVLSRG